MSDYYADDVVSLVLLVTGGAVMLVGLAWLLYAWLHDVKAAPLPPRPVRRQRCFSQCPYTATREALHADGGIVAVCEGCYAEGVLFGWLVEQEVGA